MNIMEEYKTIQHGANSIELDKIWDEIAFLRSRIDNFDDEVLELKLHQKNPELDRALMTAYSTVNQLLHEWTQVQNAYDSDEFN